MTDDRQVIFSLDEMNWIYAPQEARSGDVIHWATKDWKVVKVPDGSLRVKEIKLRKGATS